ncbi:MAG: hypothetical protein E6R04_08975 [Spirochaetes bacterium]|nr:MAG: hypothetical protein E6R04_08975 [Spirochaetota bacterium]
MDVIVDIPRAELRAALEAFLGNAVPDTVTVPWVCNSFGIADKSVRHAIKTGKLPHTSIKSRSGSVSMYLVKPEDAFLLWGYRLMPQNNVLT